MPSSGPFRVNSDAWVNVDYPNKNYANSAGLSAQYLKKRILIHVPRPAGTLIGSNRVQDCNLYMVQKNDWNKTFTMRATLIRESWPVMNVTWANKPDLRQDSRATKTFTVTGVREGHVHTFDLANLMEAAANNNWTYTGVALMCNNNPSYEARFFAKDTAGKSPTVYWRWANEPKVPTDLHPSGTRSDTTPRFLGNTAGINVQWLRLQISQTPSFSGSLVKNLSVYRQWGTNSIDYVPGTEFGAPLPSNAIYYWRCYYITENGMSSSWSRTVQMAIKSKPTINITSVVSAITTDITPLLTWDYTPGEGGIQSRAEVRIYERRSDKWVIVLVAGVPGTTTEYEIGDGVLRNGSYRQAIQVWDTPVIPRDHDNTDKAYAQDATEWACMPDKDTRGVDDLTAAPITTPSRLAYHGIMPVMRLTWNRNEVPDLFKIHRKINEETPKELISVGEPADYSPDYSEGNYEFIDSVPGGADIRYFVTAVVGKKQSHSTNEFEYMAGVPLTAAWEVAVDSATAVLQQLYDRYTWNQHFARVAITDGGAGLSSVQFRQDLPLAVPDSIYRITLRARSLENPKTVQVLLRRKSAPYTVYGQYDVNLTDEWALNTWFITVSEEFELRLTLFCGGNDDDVDIDYFVSYTPGASVVVTPIETQGFWLVPETRPKWAIPFTRNVENDIEYDENVGETHPIGGKYNLVRAPEAAQKIEISAMMDRETLGIYYLERIIEDNLTCRLSSSRGTYARVVVGKGLKITEVGELHGRKMYKVSITCLEIGPD